MHRVYAVVAQRAPDGSFCVRESFADQLPGRNDEHLTTLSRSTSSRPGPRSKSRMSTLVCGSSLYVAKRSVRASNGSRPSPVPAQSVPLWSMSRRITISLQRLYGSARIVPIGLEFPRSGIETVEPVSVSAKPKITCAVFESRPHRYRLLVHRSGMG